jgi:pyruvate/2-oxoglutarate dehydrogenase complex dihydrolipoamide dehydrogenase (E3) component
VAVQYRSGSEQARLEVAAVFFAVGWPGNADALGADAVGIAITRGYVQVSQDLRSSLPHVLAAGDVNGISMLVPSARHEGRIAAENAVLGTAGSSATRSCPLVASPIPSTAASG